MTFKAKSILLATALLAVSGYSAADTPGEQSSAGSEAPVIVTGTHAGDREIRVEVMRRIDERPALRTENIDVQSFDHNVYLYGVVSSRMEGEQAEAVARTVPGVRSVHNALGSFGA
jgi:osmotically-inducible protein OsmY